MPVSDKETDFDFYLRFARPLVLNLNKPNDRALAAAWVQKLRDEKVGTEKLRTNYLKLLLFILQRKKIIGVFSKSPDKFKKLEEFPDTNLHNVAKELLKVEEKFHKQEILNRVSLVNGDSPPTYSTELSPDLLEYSAAQDIPNFGVHAYYAISKEPLQKWDHTEKAVSSRGVSSTTENSATRSEHTSRNRAVSSDRIEDIPTKSKSDHKTSKESQPKSHSQSTLKSQHKSCPDLGTDHYETMDLKNTTPTIETSQTTSSIKKSYTKNPLPPQLENKDVKQESREPPTWGSNLVCVSEAPVREITTEPFRIEEADPAMFTSHPSMFGTEEISSECANILNSSSATKRVVAPTNANTTLQNSSHCRSKIPRCEKTTFFTESPPSFLEADLVFSSSSSESYHRSLPCKRPSPGLSGGKEYDMVDLNEREFYFGLDELKDDNEGKEGTSRERQNEQNKFDRMIPEYEREDPSVPVRPPAPRQAVASTSRNLPISYTRLYQYSHPSLRQPGISVRTVVSKTISRTMIPVPQSARSGGSISRIPTTRVSRCPTAGSTKDSNIPNFQKNFVTPTNRIPPVIYQRPHAERTRQLSARTGQVSIAQGSQIPINRRLYVTTSGTRIPLPSQFSSTILAPTLSSSRIPVFSQRIPTQQKRTIPVRKIPTYSSAPFPQGEASPFFLESPPSGLMETSFSSTSEHRTPPFPQGEASPFFLESPPDILTETSFYSPRGHRTPPFPQGEASPFFLESPPGVLTDISFSSPLGHRTPPFPQGEASPFFLESPPGVPTENSFSSPRRHPTPPFPQVEASPFFLESTPDVLTETSFTSSPKQGYPSSSFSQRETDPIFLRSFPISPAQTTHSPPLSPKTPCKPCGPGSPTQTYDSNELKDLGLRSDDFDEDVFNLEDIENLDSFSVTVPSDADHELSQYKPDDSYITRELDEWDRKIAELEAEHAEDIALYGSPQQTICPETCKKSPKSPTSKTTTPSVVATRSSSPREARNVKVPVRQKSAIPEDEKKQVITKSKTKITSVKPGAGVLMNKSIQKIKKIEKEIRVVDAPPVTSADQAMDSFEECERACGIVKPVTSKPAAISKDVEYNIRAAQAAANKQYQDLMKHAALADEYEKYKERYKYRRPDVPKTPPVFSKYAELMGVEAKRVYRPSEFGLTENTEWVPAETFFEGKTNLSPWPSERRGNIQPFMGREVIKQYHPSEFGVTEDIEWVPAEQYFEGKTELSPRPCQRGEDVKQLLPGVQRQIEAEQFFETEAEPEYLDEIDEELRNLSEEMQRVEGMSVLTPDKSPSPKRPVEKRRIEQERLYFESPPLVYYDSPSESPLSPKSAQALPAPYGLPKRVLFPPVQPVDMAKLRMKSNLRDIQEKAKRQLHLLDSPTPLNKQEEEDIDMYVAPERRELAKRVAHLISDVPDTFIRRHEFKEWNLPTVSETAGILQEIPLVYPESPSPISPMSRSPTPKRATPRKSPSPARSQSPARPASSVRSASPTRSASPVRNVSSAQSSPSERSHLPAQYISLFDMASPTNLAEELPPENFYSSSQVLSGIQSTSPDRCTKSPTCLICKLHEAGEPANSRSKSPKHVCKHLTLLEKTPTNMYVTPRRIKMAQPRIEPVRESPIKVPQFTYKDYTTGARRTIEELEQLHEEPTRLTFPEDLLDTRGPINWQQSDYEKSELDRSPPEGLPSPMKPPTVIPGWVTPPRLRTPARPLRAKLPGPAEQFILTPFPRENITEERHPTEFLYSPPQLSPGELENDFDIDFSLKTPKLIIRPPYVKTPTSPFVGDDTFSAVEDEQQPKSLYHSPLSKTPPLSPGSPLESPTALHLRLYRSEDPKYYSKEYMYINTGRTSAKRKLIKRKSSAPSLYKLREHPEAFHEEHLPFLSQVEAAKPFPTPGPKKMRVIAPLLLPVEDSSPGSTSRKIKTITSRRKVGVDTSNPFNPVVTEVVETEETIEDAEPAISTSVKDVLKTLDKRYAALPEVPLTPPPEDLIGIASSTPFIKQPPGILDRATPQGLPSPIKPPTMVPGWSTPPHLRTPVIAPPPFEFKLHPNLKNILFQEMPPPEMTNSPTSSRTTPPPTSCSTTSASPLKPQRLLVETPSTDQRETQAVTPPRDVFQEKPQYLVVEMPPGEFMPPGSPPSPETIQRNARFIEQCMSPDTTVDSFEQHERSVADSPSANVPPASFPPKSEISPSSRLQEINQKIDQQYKVLTEVSCAVDTPERLEKFKRLERKFAATASPCSKSLERSAVCAKPQQLLDKSLEDYETAECAVSQGTPVQARAGAPSRAVFGQMLDAASRAHQQYLELLKSPDTSLEDYEAIEQAICGETPGQTRANAPCRAVFDQMIESASRAHQQYAELQKSPTWLERVEYKIRDVPDPHLPQRKPVVSPQSGAASPSWSPTLPRAPRYVDQIDTEFLPEVWGYVSPKTPPRTLPKTPPRVLPKTPPTISPLQPFTPMLRSPQMNGLQSESPPSFMATYGSPRPNVFDVEPASAEYLDSIAQPNMPGSPDEKLITPPRIEDYYKVHTPPSPGSPDRFSEAIQSHMFTKHYYDKNKKLLTPYVQVKNKKIPQFSLKHPQLSPVKEASVDDFLDKDLSATEIIEEIVEEIINDTEAGLDELGLSFVTPPKLQAYADIPAQQRRDELMFQSPPLFYQSPKQDIFEEAETSPVSYQSPEQGIFREVEAIDMFDVSPPQGYNVTPPNLSLEEGLSTPQNSVTKSPYSNSPSPGFKQSLKEHQYTFDRGARIMQRQNRLYSPPLERIEEQYPEYVYYPTVSQLSSREQRSPTYDLPKPIYYGSPGRECIRTPIRRMRQQSPPRDSPCIDVCISDRLPFAEQTSPIIMDTSLIPSDLEASFMEEDQANFRWMG